MKVGDKVYQKIDMREYFITKLKNESISLYSCKFINGDKLEQIASFNLEKFKRDFHTIKEIRKLKLEKLQRL